MPTIEHQLGMIIARRDRAHKLTDQEKLAFEISKLRRLDKLEKIKKAMKHYRNRRKAGVRVFRVQATTRFMMALVEEGFMPMPQRPEDVDHWVITEAIFKMLNYVREQRRQKEAAGG
jgi:hypothetical protein